MTMKQMKLHKLIFTFLCVGQFAYAQIETLNQFNSKGKKTGLWKVTLDNKVDPIDSFKNAYFFGLEQWDNGYKVLHIESTIGHSQNQLLIKIYQLKVIHN